MSPRKRRFLTVLPALSAALVGSLLVVPQHVLNNDALTGTIFDGGNPAMHAGPQAMTDGQTLPVF